jgi:hypothetical protein
MLVEGLLLAAFGLICHEGNTRIKRDVQLEQSARIVKMSYPTTCPPSFFTNPSLASIARMYLAIPRNLDQDFESMSFCKTWIV